MNLSQSLIVDYTLYLLGFFSLLSWVVILLKAGELLWYRLRNARFFREYAAESGLDLSLGVDSQAGRVFERGLSTLKSIPETALSRPEQYRPWHDLLESSLKQQIQQEKARLDSGLGWLATFGSISPFVGLFGTVWGIMHALQDISEKGSASLEVVAGPIGEALIATALGIAVAIPAVMGYNFYLRQNRKLVQQLEQFANNFLHNTIKKHLLQQTVSVHGYTDTK
ncbi:MAG: MotA/TolQ/ExbB proton channel family protein [Methylococcales bacterium]